MPLVFNIQGGPVYLQKPFKIKPKNSKGGVFV